MNYEVHFDIYRTKEDIADPNKKCVVDADVFAYFNFRPVKGDYIPLKNLIFSAVDHKHIGEDKGDMILAEFGFYTEIAVERVRCNPIMKKDPEIEFKIDAYLLDNNL